MPYIVLFTDNSTASPELRAKHMEDHLSFLAAHSDTVVAAGPLETEAGAGDGGMWLVEADTMAEVERLIREDPFWSTGLRHSHRVLAWRQVFAR